MQRYGVFFTTKIFVCIISTLKFGNRQGLHPATWNNHTNRAEKGPRFQQRLWKIHLCISMATFAFVMLRCAEHILHQEKHPGPVYMLFVSGIYAMGLLMHASLYLNQDQVLGYVNKAIRFGKFMEDAYVTTPKTNPTPPVLTKVMEKLIQLTYCFFFYVVPSLLSILGILKSNSPEQLSSVLAYRGPIRGIGVAATLLSVCISAHTIILFCISSAVTVVCALAGGLPILLSLYELRAPQATNGDLRTPQNRIRVYQMVRLLINIWNNTFGAAVVPAAQAIVCFFTVICTYASIRLGGIQALVMAIVGLTLFAILIVGFSVLAEVHDQSKRLLLDWKCEQNQPKLFTLRTRSLPTVRCYMRSAYYVDKYMVMTMAAKLADQTVSFLVAHP